MGKTTKPKGVPNEHAPLVLRDGDLIPWEENVINISAPAVQYGYGGLDGIPVMLRVDGEKVFLSTVDAGAHFARHLFNARAAVHFDRNGTLGTLDEALQAGRNYDLSYPLQLHLKDRVIDLRTYCELYTELLRANMERGFVHGNYVRPFYGISDQRKDGLPNDFRIDESLYHPLFSVMPMYWPELFGPRLPDFSGLNLLLSQRAASPYHGTSLIRYKASSVYAGTRGPAVREKVDFNKSTDVAAHDVLLLDYMQQHVREASGSNLFLVGPNGVVCTPIDDGSIFPGVTRDFVIRLVHDVLYYTHYMRLTELVFSIRTLREFAVDGGELFLAGSALGIIPVQHLFVPVPSQDGKTAYETISFNTGPGTHTAIIQDCYKCFSIGEGFEVEGPRGKERFTDFASWPLLVEVPEHLREIAKQKFMGVHGLKKPLDQILISGKVKPVAAEKRIAAVSDGRRRIRA